MPSLALQLLLRANPTWREHPAAVVLEDKPQGTILQVNEHARRFRVLPGMRYAAGLSMAPGLRAGVVEQAEIDAAVDELTELMRRFSPNVEPCRDEPGVLWVDARGLGRLWASLSQWGRAVADCLREEGWHASVVVGFGRFSTYAIARTRLRDRHRLLILGDEEAERRLCKTVTLDRIGLDSKARDGLQRLGVVTIGDLLALPSAGVMRRFGGEAERLWRLARGDRKPRLRAEAAVPPVRAVMHLDHGTVKSSALLFMVKRLLSGLTATLAQRSQVLEMLTIELVLDGGKRLCEQLRPAEATLDERTILDLARLRLERLSLPAEVMDIVVTADGAAASTAQLRMYFDRPRRDVSAGNAALARLRAELGDTAVQFAQLQDGHLPEAKWVWAPLLELPERAALPRKGLEIGEKAARPLVRRLLAAPKPLPPQSRHVRNDGWLVSGLQHGSVVRSTGPFLVSGGWWRKEIHREYQFCETQRGDVLWVFYDRLRRRWFLHGVVC